MVHYQRYFQHLRKGEDTMIRRLMHAGGAGDDGRAHGLCNSSSYKRASPKLVFLFSLSLLSFLFVWFSSTPFAFSSNFLLSYSFGAETAAYVPPCSSIPNGTICCDRSNRRTDICFMKGDVRTHSSSKSIHLYSSPSNKRNKHTAAKPIIEKIKPYTRKWETSVMDTVESLTLIQNPSTTTTTAATRPRCDVYHDVPAVVFSTGGYTGNLYHEFNDGIIPLYITSQHLNGKVVFVIMEYHNWWFTKYGDVVSQLSDYPLVDFDSDTRTHCFPEANAGLRIHDELTVDPGFMVGNKGIKDFRDLLDRAYRPRIESLVKEADRRREEEELASSSSSSSPASAVSLSPEAVAEHSWSSFDQRRNDDPHTTRRPRLVVLSRTGSRAITNEAALVTLAERTGFDVRVVRPVKTSELAKIYKALNESEVLIGVHGAAMTHLLFMRPRCVFIQIVPIGTDWAAEVYYGEPAVKLGLKYVNYSISPTESSLYQRYGEDDPVIRDPGSIGIKGWEYTKKIYLDDQTIEVDVKRFGKVLRDARKYVYSEFRGKRRDDHQFTLYRTH